MMRIILFLLFLIACVGQANAQSFPGYTDPVVNPSSGNLVGPGCVTAHQPMYADQNVCSAADSWQMVSTDPSAGTTLSVGASCTSGDVITLTFYYGSVSTTAAYTVATTNTGNACYTPIVNGLVSAIQANSTLYNNLQVKTAFGTTGQGGYGIAGQQYQIGYTVAAGPASFVIDWNTAYHATTGTLPMAVKYTVSGSATETITVPPGYFGGPIYGGGTSGGSANAQTVTATGFANVTGTGFTFTAGATNTGAMTINVNSLGAKSVQYYSNGTLTNATAGVVTSGVTYAAVLDTSGVYVIDMTAIWEPGGSTAGTTYQLPNALDNNPAYVTGRVVPAATAAPAPGSIIFALYGTGATSSTPGTRNANYGSITDWVQFALGGNAQDAWLIQPNQGSGWWFGGGVYPNVGCLSPFDPTTATCFIDEGNGSVNATSYWLYATKNGNGAELTYTGGNIELTSGAGGWPILITSAGAVTLTSTAGVEIGAPTGGAQGANTLNVSGVYYANGTAGVTCSGSPTSSFASVNGIVTHC